MAQIPAEGPITLDLEIDFDKLTNGEKRILVRETGLKTHVIARQLKKLRDDDADDEDIELDLLDIEYAFGRIGLRRKYGVEADTPANADRVLFELAAKVDPTEAS